MSSKIKQKNKIKLKDTKETIKYCNNCNPKKHLKFNFSFCKQKSEPAQHDAKELIEKLCFLSSDTYNNMMIKYKGNKKVFIELISTDKLDITIPAEFRALYPTETNEKYGIFRIYSAGTPNGTANPRIIGMIKNTIFYIFFIDWKGNMYNH